MPVARTRFTCSRAAALAVAALVATVLAEPRPAGAQTGDPCHVLYAVDSSSDSLSILDLEGRQISAVGPVGTITPIALAVRPSDGTIYVWDNASRALMTVDRCTGQGTILHPTGQAEDFFIYDLVFTPEGRLFGLGPLLMELDADTGLVHSLGAFHDQEGRTLDLVHSAVFAPDGRLFALTDSNTSFAPTELGVLDLPSGTLSISVRLDLPDTDVPQDLIFDAAGNLLLTDLRSFSAEPWGFYLVDPGTGVTRLLWSAFLLPQSMAYGIACGVPIAFCLQQVVGIFVDLSNPIGRGSAVVSWTTAREDAVGGFNLVRIDDRGTRTQLNNALVPCEECITGGSHTYSLIVPKQRGGQDLFVELVRLDGGIETYGPAARR